MNNNNLEKFMRDFEKVINFQKEYGNLECLTDFNTEKLINYVFDNKIVTNTLELIVICEKFPTYKEVFCEKYDNMIKKSIETTKNNNKSTYSSTPCSSPSTISSKKDDSYGYFNKKNMYGYNTIWNDRCFPSESEYRKMLSDNNRC